LPLVSVMIMAFAGELTTNFARAEFRRVYIRKVSHRCCCAMFYGCL